MTKLLMTLAEATAQTPWKDTKVLRAAIQQAPGTKYPPLRAKRGSKGEYLIPARALEESIDQLPDA